MTRPTITAAERAAIEASANRYVNELTRHLKTAARARGRAVDLPDPLMFRDLLTILAEIEIEPAEFFPAVIRRWRRVDVARLRESAKRVTSSI